MKDMIEGTNTVGCAGGNRLVYLVYSLLRCEKFAIDFFICTVTSHHFLGPMS